MSKETCLDCNNFPTCWNKITATPTLLKKADRNCDSFNDGKTLKFKTPQGLAISTQTPTKETAIFLMPQRGVNFIQQRFDKLT